MITIVTFKWRGWRGNLYTPHHVRLLRDSLQRTMTMPFRFVCVTDDRRAMRDIECVDLWGPPPGMDAEVMGRPNCYRRMFLFSEEAQDIFGPRALQMDLDCLVKKDLSPIIPPAGTGFKAVRGKSAYYNGSMWYVEPGYRPDVWTKLNQDNADTAQDITGGYGSDQVWMSYMLPCHEMWGPEDGVYQHRLHGDGHDNERVVFYAGGKRRWKYKAAAPA